VAYPMSCGVPPLAAARSARCFALLVLGVVSGFLSLVGVGKMHVHIVWREKQVNHVTKIASAALHKPLIQPILQRGSHTQEEDSTSMASASSQAGDRPNRGVCMC